MVLLWDRNTGKIRPAKARVSTEKLYTSSEIVVLAREFVDTNYASASDAPDALKLRLFMGAFIAWLQQREKEGEG